MTSRICSFALAAGTALLLAGCGGTDGATPKNDDTPLPAGASSGADAGHPNPDVEPPVPDWPPASHPAAPSAETRDDSPPEALSDMVSPTDEAPPEVVPDSVLIDEPEPPEEEPM